MRIHSLTLTACFVFTGCHGGGLVTTDSSQPQSTIQTGDSLLRTIESLRQHQITVIDATPAGGWSDGKDRRMFQVSKSRKPTDALVLVALRPTAGTDPKIESMYWDIDFIRQYVPFEHRPPLNDEPIESVAISELVADLQFPDEMEITHRPAPIPDDSLE